MAPEPANPPETLTVPENVFVVQVRRILPPPPPVEVLWTLGLAPPSALIVPDPARMLAIIHTLPPEEALL